jgi:cytochrome P450 family 135
MRHVHPPTLPPTAPIPAPLQTLASRVRPLEYLEWCRAHIGRRFTVRPIGMPPLIFLADAKDIRTVVTAPLTVLHAGRGAAITAPLFGKTSFLLKEGDEYLQVRNAITPAFHRRLVREHTDLVAQLAEREVSHWPVDTVIATYPRFAAITLRVILKTVFGERTPTVRCLHGAMLRMLSVAASPVLQQPRLRFLPGWRHTWHTFIGHREEVNALIAALIRERRDDTGQHVDMLEMLLDAHRPDGQPMSDQELRDNLVSVIIAGHETTASALAWAVQLLAHNPAVQDRLASEIASGNDEYLTATVSEVLRHRPVFLFTAPRAVAQPIEINGWTYEPPVHLLGCTYLMHHEPELFIDPQQFQPERFLGGGASPTWLPWGGGRKVCPGRHLAQLELRTVLRALVTSRRIVQASPTIERVSWRSALVTPHAGSQVILRPRGGRVR